MKYSSNRISYIQLSANEANAKTTVPDDYITHTFGRLGQAKSTGLTEGKPFLLQELKDATTARAGFQISMFPEVWADSGALSYADWGLSSDGDRPLIKVKAKAANVSDISLTTIKTPAAESTLKPTAGAQALAASIMATAAIASTLF